MSRYALLLVLVLAGSAIAQTPGDCERGVATDTLDVNGALVELTTTGTVPYEVPRLLFLWDAVPWVTGTVGGEPRASGRTFHLTEEAVPFWPGPLDAGAAPPSPADCARYDRVWAVSVEDLAAYEEGAEPTADLAAWPVGLGAPAVDASGQPVEPIARDQTVDLAAGQRPVIHGSQTAFWVMNDVGGVHWPPDSDPLGVEVAVTAFVVASNDLALNRAAFFRYQITNRNVRPIEDMRVSLYVDPQMGDINDYVGADTTRSLVFLYNAPIEHTHDTPNAYDHEVSPAFGVDILGGSDPTVGLASLIAYNESGGQYPPVESLSEYYHVARGRWNDGTPLTAFGGGYKAGGDITTIAFPGDPVVGASWSEENTGDGSMHPYSRQFVASTGPTALAPGESRTVDVAFLTTLGADRLDSITKLRAASDRAQGLYDEGTLFETVPVPTPIEITTAPSLVSPADGAGPLAEAVAFEWAPVPGAEEYELVVSANSSLEDPTRYLLATTSYTDIPQGVPGTVYWQVRARGARSEGPYSEVRSFQYDGARSALGRVLGIVEVAGPGGTDSCAEGAVSRDGCAADGERLSVFAPGNSVLRSLNSTGSYVLTAMNQWGVGSYSGSVESVAEFAPNDYEIRFVGLDEGAYAYYGVGTDDYFGNGTRRFIQVPFEVWDIGVVVPGEENDPSDDVQLIPILFADAGDSEEAQCTFMFNVPLSLYLGGEVIEGAVTQRIYAYYPADNDYRAYEVVAEQIVSAAGGCAPNDPAVAAFIDVNRGAPLQRDVLFRADETLTVEDLEGTVIRYYTNDNFRLDASDAPGGVAPTLGAPFPNPARQRVAVPFEIGAPGPVRLAVHDVLGREVAVLVDEARAAGPQEARLDASRLAAGVYVVVLETEGGRASRTITVVR